MRTATYTTREERQTLCQEAEAGGETMLHDEIRTVRGEPVNTLVFDFPPPPEPPEPPTEHQLRQARIAELRAIGPANWTPVQMAELVDRAYDAHRDSPNADCHLALCRWLYYLSAFRCFMAEPGEQRLRFLRALRVLF